MRWSRRVFACFPGGILSKGIVRGYVGALGLDQQDWTERFLQAYNASGQMLDDDRSWTAFASNVGKARILRHEAAEMRLRWLGAILLLLVVAAAAFLTVRYYGMRVGLVAQPCCRSQRHTRFDSTPVCRHARQRCALPSICAGSETSERGAAARLKARNPPLNANCIPFAASLCSQRHRGNYHR